MRRLLLLISIALLLLSGVGPLVDGACAATPARSCCCRTATAPDRPARGPAARRACCCGCKVEANAPAPTRVLTRAAPTLEPAARLAGDGGVSLRLATRTGAASSLATARPCGDGLLLARYCVWRI